MTKPKDFDFNYGEWFTHEWSRRTRFGRFTLTVVTTGLLAFLLVFSTIFVLPKAIAARFASKLPDTYREVSESIEETDMEENNDSGPKRVKIAQNESYLHYLDGDDLVRVNTSGKTEEEGKND